jgi:hypothetical protein
MRSGARPRKSGRRDDAEKMNRIPRFQTSDWRSAIVPGTTEFSHVNSSAAIVLSAPERAALKVFKDYHVASGKMFCFTGPLLEKHRQALGTLVEKGVAIKEQFSGGYSLTPCGHRAMATR